MKKNTLVLGAFVLVFSSCGPVGSSVQKTGLNGGLPGETVAPIGDRGTGGTVTGDGRAEADSFAIETRVYPDSDAFEEEVKNLPDGTEGSTLSGGEIDEFTKDGDVKIEFPQDFRSANFLVMIDLDKRDNRRNNAKVTGFELDVKRVGLRTFRFSVSENTRSEARKFVLKHARRITFSYTRN